MEDSLILKKNPDMVTRQIDKETMLVPVVKASDDINCIYTLNETASFVWSMIDGKKTIAQIKKAVLAKFDTTASEADKKLGSLVKDLKKAKAIL
jgi:methyltransferase-like protein